MEIMVVAFWMVLWGAIGAFVCQAKGRTTLGFLLGAALGPLGPIAALFVRDRRVLCAYCRSPLLAADATVCARCGREVVSLTPVPPNGTMTEDRLQAVADARASSAAQT